MTGEVGVAFNTLSRRVAVWHSAAFHQTGHVHEVARQFGVDHDANDVISVVAPIVVGPEDHPLAVVQPVTTEDFGRLCFVLAE